jgi:choline monooxygenase
MTSLREIIESYNSGAPLAQASTIPSAWYTDPRIFALEKETVFKNSWQFAARADQLQKTGDYVTTQIAGEPIVLAVGADRVLRGFFNVCRHHAAAVMTDPAGTASQMRCPYHGWTYSLEGELKGTPDFSDVCNFDRNANGLVSIPTAAWENWVLVRLGGRPSPTLTESANLEGYLGSDLIDQFRGLDLQNLHWFERRHYSLECNWKVFVDNFLDGGYHVPHLHKGLDSVLDYRNYTIENGARHCLQSSPMIAEGAESHTGAVRKGDRARYYWIYPNLMINCYADTMDTNLVVPLAIDKTAVIFDFYFADVSTSAGEHNQASVNVGERIQDEDVAICESVQRGLNSRAYDTGRLSVRREAGEHLFHRLLHADLWAGLSSE